MDKLKTELSNKFDLETFIPFRMNVSSGAISALIEEHCLAPENISQAQWRILTTLGSEGPSAQGRFIKRSPMDKITVTRTVKSLLNSELIESKESALDRRSRLLNLTPKGLALYKKLITKAMQIEQDLLIEAGITQPDEFIERLSRFELAVKILRRKYQ